MSVDPIGGTCRRRQAPLDPIAYGEERAGVTAGQEGLSPVEVFVYRGDSTSAEVGAEFFLNSHAEAY